MHIISLLLLASCALRPDRPRVSADRIPKAVREEASARVARVFQDDELQGIPLLDPSIDWDALANWPEEFSFRGYHFKAAYGLFGSDYIDPVASRTALKPSREQGYYIRFAIERTNAPPVHSFTCYWSKRGIVTTRHLIWNEKDVFVYLFYPNGRLQGFSRDDAEGGRMLDYFDVAGRQVGTHRGSSYVWRNREVTPDNFFKNVRRLFVESFPQER